MKSCCNCGGEDENRKIENNCSETAEPEKSARIFNSELIISAILFAAGIALNAAKFPLPVAFRSLPAAFLFFASYIIVARDVISMSVKNILKGQIFDENFLMSIASICAFAIGEFPEAAAVMLFWQAGEKLQDIAVERSRKSISALADLRPDFANVKRDSIETKLNPGDVKIGEVIVVRPGEKIPLDGIVLNGTSELNTAAITGESEPRSVSAGSEVFSGCVCLDSAIEITVTKEYANSTVQKILELCETAQSKKSRTERFITRFAKIYTPIVCGLALIIGVAVPLLFGFDFKDWLNRGLIFLVASCPCALVVSVPLSYFCGIGQSSRRGVLVKGGEYLDILARVDTAVFDKTGTLTEGKFHVAKIITADKTISESDLLETAAMIEFNSNHPAAIAIKKACTKTVIPPENSYLKEIPGKGAALEIRTDGKKDVYLAGNSKLVTPFPENQPLFKDSTSVHISKNNAYLGTFVLTDKVRSNSAKLVSELKKMNIKTVMLTGDSSDKAEKTAAELGINEFSGDLLPQDKYALLEKLELELASNKSLMFMGDGINDAPVLARADIGVAMGGIGSDSAIESADAVIMNDDPHKIISAIYTAKKTAQIVKENIIFALSIKFAVMALAVLGLDRMWHAVFADVGVTLLAVLNAAAAINVKSKADY